MFCIQCGKKIGNSDRFCCFCGTETPENITALQCSPCLDSEPEHLLLAFGPLGFSIGRGSAELFTWEYKNITRFEITTRRFRTVHQSALLFSIRRTMELDIPIEAIESAERYSRSFIAFGLMGVLGIKYHARDGLAEINIIGNKGILDKAHSLLTSLRQRVWAERGQ